jgi:hypothetical protein
MTTIKPVATRDGLMLPVESWDIAKIFESSKNAKKHPEEEVVLLRKSIRKYGIANPLNVKPSGEIITGHGRRLAALGEGWKQVPVIVRHDLTDAEADALRISDNATSGTNYDTELLQAQVSELAEAGEIEMDTLGFGDVELERLTASFDDMNMDAMVEDINAAVETQKVENTASEAAVDSTAAPVTDALGFKRVTIEQSRRVRGFMNSVETKTGLTGAAALVAYIDTLGIAA